MKPKAIADASDHFRMNDDINHDFRKIQDNPSSVTSHSNDHHKLGPPQRAASSPRNYPRNSRPNNNNISPNFRRNIRGKPFRSAPFHYKDRDLRKGRLGDNNFFKNATFRQNNFRHFLGSTAGAKTDWIDGMCWFHYTKGQSATSCMDSQKCSGYKSFHKPS